jgi:hypothetical protein
MKVVRGAGPDVTPGNSSADERRIRGRLEATDGSSIFVEI